MYENDRDEGKETPYTNSGEWERDTDIQNRGGGGGGDGSCNKWVQYDVQLVVEVIAHGDNTWRGDQGIGIAKY